MCLPAHSHPQPPPMRRQSLASSPSVRGQRRSPPHPPATEQISHHQQTIPHEV